ncbi:zinc-dependent alcohol dehydrogenase [Flindersiella endophytica]
MKALCWSGPNRLTVESVPDPTILNEQDAIIRVTASSVCGSDLHLLGGYVPGMLAGDIIGHEFIGEIVEVGPGVSHRKQGERVVVCSILGCGRCWHCSQDEWSSCDNSNPNPALTEAAYGHSAPGIFGYSHAFGGFAGSHADYIRVPYADYGTFRVPEGLPDEKAVFASDAVPTGWQGADLADIEPGDTVAVWGCGGVGLMAIRAAYLMNAERVIAIDRVPERLDIAEQQYGAIPLNYQDTDDVVDALRELTAGRGPRRCIEAVGMEGHSDGLQYAYDRVKQAVRLETDRAPSLREAIIACAKGGTVSVLGVFGGLVDKFPMGAVVNKALTVRSGQQAGQRYIPRLLEQMAAGQIDTGPLLTHPMSLDEGPLGYDLFKHKKEGCLRAVFFPER